MKTFLVTYHAPLEAVQSMSQASQEEIAEATKPWMEWKSNNEKHIIDFGSRLSQGIERSTNSSWVSSDKEVTGFSILKAKDIEELKRKLEYHPQLTWSPDNKIGVYEFYGF